MSFTSKVSNIIKQQITSNLISGFNNAAFGQPKKLAAKLASKSPLDLSQSPVAHMEPIHHPFKYGNVYYPEETTNLGDGHYIIFDIIEHTESKYGDSPSKMPYPQSLGRVGEAKLNRQDRLDKLLAQGFQTENKILRDRTSGLQKMEGLNFHTRISDSIILYTPPTGNKFDYTVGHENVDTKISSQLRGLFEGGKILEKLEAAGSTFLREVATAAMEIALPGFGAVVQKDTGTAVNPKAELVFTGVPFREFNFPYEFAPKNEKEKDSVQKIINLLKFHMMPELDGPGHLRVPSEFQITYMYRDRANMYIPKISRCVLKNMSVDYSPEGVFTTFRPDDKGAHPVLTKMDLTFTETEIMTKETIAKGH